MAILRPPTQLKTFGAPIGQKQQGQSTPIGGSSIGTPAPYVPPSGIPNYSSPGGYGSGSPAASGAGYTQNNQFNNGQPTKPAPIQGGGGVAPNASHPYANGPFDQRIDPMTGQPYPLKIGQSAADIQPDFSRNYLGVSADQSRAIERIALPGELPLGAFRIGGLDNMLAGYGGQFNNAQQQQQLAQGQANTQLGNSAQSRALALGALTAPGPSAAEGQLFAGQEAAARNALAMARSGRGFGSAGQMQQAQFAGQEALGATNQQAAVLRAQEEAARRQQLLALGGMDLGALGMQYQQGLGAGAQGMQALGMQGQLSQAQQQAFSEKARTDLAAYMKASETNAQFANYEQPAAPDNTWSDIGAATGAAGGALAGAAGLVAMFSDRDSKTKIQALEQENSALRKDASSLGALTAADRFAQIPSYSYEYKNPAALGAAPGQQVGPMAQDIERVLPGAVQDTAQGKMVDPSRMVMANAAATSELARRLEALEAKGTSALGAITAGGKKPVRKPEDLGTLPAMQVNAPSYQNLGALPPMSVSLGAR